MPGILNSGGDLLSDKMDILGDKKITAHYLPPKGFNKSAVEAFVLNNRIRNNPWEIIESEMTLEERCELADPFGKFDNSTAAEMAAYFLLQKTAPDLIGNDLRTKCEAVVNEVKQAANLAEPAPSEKPKKETFAKKLKDVVRKAPKDNVGVWCDSPYQKTACDVLNRNSKPHYTPTTKRLRPVPIVKFLEPKKQFRQKNFYKKLREITEVPSR